MSGWSRASESQWTVLTLFPSLLVGLHLVSPLRNRMFIQTVNCLQHSSAKQQLGILVRRITRHT